MRIHELDALTFSLGGVLQDWLEHVGFTVDNLEGGGFYFDVLTHDFAA